jgi:hypothetical protein
VVVLVLPLARVVEPLAPEKERVPELPALPLA